MTSIPNFVSLWYCFSNRQGRSKRLDRVDSVQGTPEPKRTPKTTMGLDAVTVPCPWAPEGLAMPVQTDIFRQQVTILC